jgi:hypothetical protein
MPFDEQRQFGPPTGRSSATNTYGANGGVQRGPGSAESPSSARADLITGLGTPRAELGFDSPDEKPEAGPVPAKSLGALRH